MRAISRLIILLAVMAVSTLGQRGSVGKPYILTLLPDCDPASLSIKYYITGSFGGARSFVRTEAKKWEYEIPTISEDGKPARTLKVIVKGPKYKTLTFDFPSINENGGSIEAKLEKQTYVEFRGKISSSESITDDWMQLTVDHIATWECEFFGVADCLLGPDFVASFNIDRDGSFKAMLPDFANDPALSTFRNKGYFQFDIRDRKTGNRVYDLKPVSNQKGEFGIPFAPGYPEARSFIAERPK